jgi:protease PrsW
MASMIPAVAGSPRSGRSAFLRSGWLRALMGGSAIYALLTVATVDTQNLHLVPAVLVLGALLIPVTFVIFVFERLSIQAAVLPALAVCFTAGGSLGVAAASVLEYQTLRDLGALPMLAVGLIEESVKLVVPLWLLLRGRFRAPADGVLFGVAAGMGFAALETMGYGLVALIQSGGRIGAAEQVVLVRGLLSPVGHAAWTGLVCAALWRMRATTGEARPWVALIAAFTLAVALHALWDSTDSIPARVAIGLLSGTLLAAQIRRVRRDSPTSGAQRASAR